ncbi:MAG: undecaprenyl-diphosphate phosphatase [Bdellovibrionota bacterium]|nr:undecaprenyl-diphosphate phosphatase [Bdellovibrionota bacterium]
MDSISAFFLGAIQGLTEFLPVSSSGHLVIGQKLFGFEFHDIFFDVVLHLGTLIAVLIVYRKVIIDIIKEVFEAFLKRKNTTGLMVLLYMFIASIPTALIGLGFKDQFEALFQNIQAVAACLAFTGAVLLLQKFLRKEHKQEALSEIRLNPDLLKNFSWKVALFIGIAQSLAIAPGVSRSGMTISMGLILGLAGAEAALFSFLIAIPAILGASLLQLKDLGDQVIQWQSVSIGFGSALIFGYLGLIAVLKLVRKQRLELFSVYLWVLSIAVLML